MTLDIHLTNPRLSHTFLDVGWTVKRFEEVRMNKLDIVAAVLYKALQWRAIQRRRLSAPARG